MTPQQIRSHHATADRVLKDGVRSRGREADIRTLLGDTLARYSDLAPVVNRILSVYLAEKSGFFATIFSGPVWDQMKEVAEKRMSPSERQALIQLGQLFKEVSIVAKAAPEHLIHREVSMSGIALQSFVLCSVNDVDTLWERCSGYDPLINRTCSMALHGAWRGIGWRG